MSMFLQVKTSKSVEAQRPLDHQHEKIWINVHTIESVSSSGAGKTRIIFWGLQGYTSKSGRGYIVDEDMSNLMKRIEDAGTTCVALPEPEPEPEEEAPTEDTPAKENPNVAPAKKRTAAKK